MPHTHPWDTATRPEMPACTVAASERVDTTTEVVCTSDATATGLTSVFVVSANASLLLRAPATEVRVFPLTSPFWASVVLPIPLPPPIV